MKIKVNMQQLSNFYKIYCNKTLNPKHRLFKDFSEFSYICTRVGAEKILRDFNRKTFSVSKIHDIAMDLLMFGNKEAFADIDPDNLVPKCPTLEATLRLCKNKNINEILEVN